MASTIMHIAVASQIYKKINDKSNISYYDYILGAIAPDVSKQVGIDKKLSHFITDNSSNPNLILFLEKYKDFMSNSFNLGYYVHLYTDKLFYTEYLPLFIQDDLLSSNVKFLDGNILNLSIDERKNLLYNDYTNLNLLLIDKYNLDLEIFYNAYRKPVTEICEVMTDKLDVLIKNIGIIIENCKSEKRYIIDIDSITSFIDTCSIEIFENLRSLGLV